MGLQLNLQQQQQQQLEEFPVGLSWCQRRAPQFPHCGRELCDFLPLVKDRSRRLPASPRLFSSRSLFPVSFQLAKCEQLPLSPAIG